MCQAQGLGSLPQVYQELNIITNASTLNSRTWVFAESMQLRILSNQNNHKQKNNIKLSSSRQLPMVTKTYLRLPPYQISRQKIYILFQSAI